MLQPTKKISVKLIIISFHNSLVTIDVWSSSQMRFPSTEDAISLSSELFISCLICIISILIYSCKLLLSL